MISATDKATGKVLVGEDAIRGLIAGTAMPVEVRKIETASLRHR